MRVWLVLGTPISELYVRVDGGGGNESELVKGAEVLPFEKKVGGIVRVLFHPRNEELGRELELEEFQPV